MTRIGIITCDRYASCAGGKCLLAMKRREGAFRMYEGREVELVAYTSCGGCPGVNVEHAPAEMKKNGVQVIHLATGLLVGYPPCPRIEYFQRFISAKYQMEVVLGTHPIPQTYYDSHTQLGTWDGSEWQPLLQATLADEATRITYN